MGHGELSASGLEMPSETIIRVELVKQKKIAGPRIESPTEIMTIVSGCPAERSMAEAFARLILWMEAE
jgi:acetamidase/formamidase